MPPRVLAGAGPPGSRLTAVRPDRRPATVPSLGLAAVMVVAGTLHFVVPRSYQRIVPPALGHAPELVAASGVAEILAGSLLAIPRTRRAGAWFTLVLLLLVWPANVQMAVDGGVVGASFPLNSAVLSWVRVPLQLPLLAWAYGLARR